MENLYLKTPIVLPQLDKAAQTNKGHLSLIPLPHPHLTFLKLRQKGVHRGELEEELQTSLLHLKAQTFLEQLHQVWMP